MRVVLGVLVGYTTLLLAPALAVDRPVSLKRLVIRSSGVGAESLVLISRDPDVLFPPILSPDAPTETSNGATLELLPPSGSTVTLTMPAGAVMTGWTSTDGAVDRYRFSNAAAPDAFSSIRSALLKQGRVLRIIGRQTGLPLDAPLGRLAVRFTTGSLRSCAVLEGSSVVADALGRFVARNAGAPAIADCSNLSLGVPTCGNDVRELAEQCDGSDDSSCPGLCQTDCTCPPICGDGVINQTSEECDVPAGGESCPAGYFGCRADCQCCSVGYACATLACCDPLRLCLPMPSGNGQCYKAFCPPSSASCESPLTCETFSGPTGSIDVCCQPEVGGVCFYMGIGPPCCGGLECENPLGQLGHCCVPAGGACTQNSDCCGDNACPASVCE